MAGKRLQVCAQQGGWLSWCAARCSDRRNSQAPSGKQREEWLV